MKNILWILSITATLLALVGCGQSIGVVDAGTYPGTIDKVVPAEEEIYVSLDSGERLELYFTEDTKLMSGGNEVEFGTLSKGDKISVTVEREGNRNIPTQVVVTP